MIAQSRIGPRSNGNSPSSASTASGMRYHALKAEGVAIGSGVVEAANKTPTQTPH